MGLFLYAVLAAEAGALRADGEGAAPAPAGILDAPLRAVESGPLAAILSDCPLAALRPERKHIAAYQRVLAALYREHDLLPMAFGSITGSDADCRGFLEAHRERLCAQLAHVAGAVEMELSLSLDGTETIPYLLARTPELRAARERSFGRAAAPSYDARLRLGELCEKALRGYREEETARLLTIFGPRCRETLALPLRRDSEIARLAMLVPRPEIEAIERAVGAAAPEFADELSFRLNGPWPAHSFVTLSL